MRVLQQVPPELWIALAGQCPDATFFHTYEWARLLRDTPSANCRIAAKAFELSPNEWVLLPLMECGSDLLGLVKYYSSNVPGVYGGWIANTEVAPADAEKIWAWLRHFWGYVEIFGNPYGGHAAPADWRPASRFTQVKELGGVRSEEDLLRGYEHGVRYYLRKSASAGFEVRPVRSRADVDAYYAMYAQAIERWGRQATSAYGADLFHNLVAAGSPGMELWGAYRDGTLAGGVVCLKHGGRWIAWHSAFSAEAFSAGVAKFLHHNLILEAWRQGYRVYDFNPSGGHEGTVRFKEAFGTARLPFTGYRRENAAMPRLVTGLRAVALRGIVW